MFLRSIFNILEVFSHLFRREEVMHFQLYSDQNQKPILGQKQLFLLIAIRAPVQSLISLLFPRMSKVLWLIYARTHCNLKLVQILKFVLPNDCVRHDGRSANARHCVAFQRNIKSSYFYRSLFVWSHNACVQLRSEQQFTKKFVSQTVVGKFSKHCVNVDEL